MSCVTCCMSWVVLRIYIHLFIFDQMNQVTDSLWKYSQNTVTSKPKELSETKVCKSEKIMTVMNFAFSPNIYIGMKFQSRINDRGSPLKRTRIHERYERVLTCPALCILLLLSLSSVSCRAHLLLPSFWVSTCRREGRGSSLTSSMLFATRKRNTAAPRCLTLFIP